MFRTRSVPASAPRHGIILLIVLSLLTLFAVVGLAFVLYADAQAQAARLFREAETPGRPDTQPELLLAYFLSQLIYDAKDDPSGVYSALRGHSLARGMYGYDDAGDNTTPYNGTGRLHTGPGTFMNPFQWDDYYLVNYTFFRDDPQVRPAERFLRDPERHPDRRDAAGGRVLDPGNLDARGLFTGWWNAPYTYPDLNNMFLAAVRADGTVLLPSFHRDWLFRHPTLPAAVSSLDPRNPHWQTPEGKYLLLRPRPIDMGPGFPYPADATGDVKNLIGAPGGNDSVWIDLGAPVLRARDGRKYKPLFAALVTDLDGRVNVNVHGNARGAGGTHLSNQGWGPWEVNLGRVLTRGNEWTNLLLGTRVPPQTGRYGRDGKPGPANQLAPPGPLPHVYSQVDFDGSDEGLGGIPTGSIRLPGFGAPPFGAFPLFPTGYGNGVLVERREHPLLNNVLQPAGDDRAFGVSNLEALLRYGDTGAPALTSELFRLCPANFRDPRSRRLVTTHSFDINKPGVMPWAHSAGSYPYRVPGGDAAAAPQGPPIPFPPLPQRSRDTGDGEFGADWRASSAALGRVDLNRSLTPYPLPSPQTADTYNRRFDHPALAAQFQQAQRDRQQLADAVYRRLLAVTGPAEPVNRAAPTDEELGPRRWLAQLAANIVDFLDEDDISTPFNFYTPADAGVASFDPGTLTGGDPDDSGALPRYWVFGTELPRVVLNEVLAEYKEPDPLAQVWVELFNPLEAPVPGQRLQPQDGFPVPLRVEALADGSASASRSAAAFTPYRLVIANRLAPRPGNDNVLGKPDQVRAQTTDQDFAALERIGDGRPLAGAPGVAPQGFVLLGPPGGGARGSVAAPLVPPQTPVARSPRLRYERNAGDERDGVTVLLRRLANPHVPYDPRPTLRTEVPPGSGNFRHAANPWYNPYLTVDYLERVPLHDATNPLAVYAARGKQQLYASHPSQLGDQEVLEPPVPLTRHTLGRRNEPLPNNAAPPDVPPHYDWLVHPDRQLISPAELLHVSGYQPHQLTQRFLTGDAPDQRFNHRVPWFDESRRLYRVFEFLETHAAGALPARTPGKINLNTIWDPEPFLALCDPQPANNFRAADLYLPLGRGLADDDADNPRTVYWRMMQARTPNALAGGGPGPADRPFLGLAAGFSAAGGDAQHGPRGLGIEDTLFRSFNGAGGRRLFQPPLPAGAGDPDSHPYLRYQLLTKIYNHVTTRSHVFAVWVTVGFFEVTDDTTRPVKLGAEVGRAENRHVRHRLFAVVDRSALASNPSPQGRFDPRAEPALVPYFSIID